MDGLRESEKRRKGMVGVNVFMDPTYQAGVEVAWRAFMRTGSAYTVGYYVKRCLPLDWLVM